jgi:hypothetical protein
MTVEHAHAGTESQALAPYPGRSIAVLKNVSWQPTHPMDGTVGKKREIELLYRSSGQAAPLAFPPNPVSEANKESQSLKERKK